MQFKFPPHFSDSRRSSGDAFLPQSRSQSQGTTEELRQAVLNAAKRAYPTIRGNVVSNSLSDNNYFSCYSHLRMASNNNYFSYYSHFRIAPQQTAQVQVDRIIVAVVQQAEIIVRIAESLPSLPGSIYTIFE